MIKTDYQIKEPLNNEQLEAVNYNSGPLLILAGAGTGKTKVLTSKIAYLIEHNMALPQQILAVTFTNKAAREMINRVENLVGMPRNRSERRRNSSTTVRSAIEIITRIVATARIVGEICSRIPENI